MGEVGECRGCGNLCSSPAQCALPPPWLCGFLGNGRRVAQPAGPDWDLQVGRGRRCLRTNVERHGLPFLAFLSPLSLNDFVKLNCNCSAVQSNAFGDHIAYGGCAGALTVGLVRQCQTIHGRDRTCIPPRLPPEWVTTLFFIIMGIISLTVTCGLLVASHWRREATKYARWIAFTGMILFCMAALIFPIGFYINEVGGQPYKLPNNTVVGSSYVLFVLSIFFTIVGLLFAGKVCLPG
nr:PREDICTED: uncharacterized protein C16orf52 homolog [Apteryx mantelli mantelli]